MLLLLCKLAIGNQMILDIYTGGVKDKLPVFIFIHGGGWILGDFPTHRRMVRDLVVASGFAAVFVNYTPSPEAHYPQAINEIYAVTRWVAANGNQLNVDGSKPAAVGNSVGGNMSAVTGLKALENGSPEIRLIVMMWPIVDADFETRSYKKLDWMAELRTLRPGPAAFADAALNVDACSG